MTAGAACMDASNEKWYYGRDGWRGVGLRTLALAGFVATAAVALHLLGSGDGAWRYFAYDAVSLFGVFLVLFVGLALYFVFWHKKPMLAKWSLIILGSLNALTFASMAVGAYTEAMRWSP